MANWLRSWYDQIERAEPEYTPFRNQAFGRTRNEAGDYIASEDAGTQQQSLAAFLGLAPTHQQPFWRNRTPSLLDRYSVARLGNPGTVRLADWLANIDAGGEWELAGPRETGRQNIFRRTYFGR